MFTTKPKPCKHCSGSGHVAFNCPRKPSAQLSTKKPLRGGKRLQKIGKVGKRLAQQRKEFLKENKAPYYCIYCKIVGIVVPLTASQMNVEHGMSKVRHPELRFEKSNLYVSCPYHNNDKGSMDMDEYIEKIKQQEGIRVVPS